MEIEGPSTSFKNQWKLNSQLQNLMEIEGPTFENQRKVKVPASKIGLGTAKNRWKFPVAASNLEAMENIQIQLQKPMVIQSPSFNALWKLKVPASNINAR